MNRPPESVHSDGEGQAMIVPAFFYGRYTEVKARTAKLVANAARGMPLEDAIPDRRALDTAVVTAGYLTLMTHRDISVAQAHFHFTLLRAALAEAEGAADTPLAERLFGEILGKDWGPLVFADPADGWFESTFIADNGHRRRPYIDSVFAHIRALDREGTRYIGQNGRLATFWQGAGALKTALLDEGFPPEKIVAGFTADSFKALYRDRYGKG